MKKLSALSLLVIAVISMAVIPLLSAILAVVILIGASCAIIKIVDADSLSSSPTNLLITSFGLSMTIIGAFFLCQNFYVSGTGLILIIIFASTLALSYTMEKIGIVYGILIILWLSCLVYMTKDVYNMWPTLLTILLLITTTLGAIYCFCGIYKIFFEEPLTPLCEPTT